MIFISGFRMWIGDTLHCPQCLSTAWNKAAVEGETKSLRGEVSLGTDSLRPGDDSLRCDASTTFRLRKAWSIQKLALWTQRRTSHSDCSEAYIAIQRSSLLCRRKVCAASSQVMTCENAALTQAFNSCLGRYLAYNFSINVNTVEKKPWLRVLFAKSLISLVWDYKSLLGTLLCKGEIKTEKDWNASHCIWTSMWAILVLLCINSA